MANPIIRLFSLLFRSMPRRLISKGKRNVYINRRRRSFLTGNKEMVGNKTDKFLLLMWKNWLLQYRKLFQTLLEILAPVLFSILLVLIRSLVSPKQNPDKIYQPLCLLPFDNRCEGIKLPEFNIPKVKNMSLVYSPASNTALHRSMGILSEMFGNIIGYNSSEQLEAHFVGPSASTTIAAVQLDDALANQEKLPVDLEVFIRFPSELRFFVDFFGQINGDTNILGEPENNAGVFPEQPSDIFEKTWNTHLTLPIYQTPGPRGPNSATGATPGYFNEGFLTLQLVITFILAIGGPLGARNVAEFNQKLIGSLPPMIRMQRFPNAKWVEDPLIKALESFVGIIIMLSFVYTCINTVKMITAEKEKQLKEAMKIMGLPNWLHWAAWFTKTFIFLLISAVLITVLLKVPWYPNTNYSVFTHSDPTVILVFILLYSCATITFCFAVSVFFSKANTAATAAGLLWFLSYAPYLILQQQYEQLGLSTKLLASLGSNTAMAYGFQVILIFEGAGEGIQWSNIGKTNNPDDSLTLGLIIMMLILDTVIYLFVAIYMEGIFPGEYGVPLPWYFPFISSYWCGQKQYLGEFQNIEKTGVQINNLTKFFGKKSAVRNLSMNIHRDQITVLLGHNGAGKTTTMSMLTGMFPPTSGTAVINGYDIRTDMDGVRASLGLCPQHNILFDDLTVSEHLYFFSRLKGLKGEAISREIEKYLELLELQTKANARSSTLSGGLKRKLCVGMALCGKSKVVMLDEPTSGMDPSARRALWDLLQKHKHGRTILLTTHFMDEADLLGDRIAIMAGGELQCCGTSFFLKKKYGAGYHLILNKTPDCDVDNVTRLLQKYIPNIQIHGSVGSELRYLLSETQSSIFEDMLQDLEENIKNLGVRSYGISLTTLEEVFLRVGECYDQGTKEGPKKKVSTFGTDESTVLLTGSKLIRSQFFAMFMKKTLSVIRSRSLQFIQVLMPVTCLVVAIVVGRSQNKSGDLPKLPMTLESYHDPITLVQESVTSKYSQAYLEVLQGYETQKVKNITKEMLELTAAIPAIARQRYIVGTSFDTNGSNPTITAWFNNNPYHSPPLALGLVLNAVYKILSGKNHSIRFVNYPLPFSTNTKMHRLLLGYNLGFQIAFNLTFSMAFVSSFYILFCVRERVCKSKLLQRVCGAKAYIFWITAFLCDLINFVFTVAAILTTLTFFQEEGFRTGNELARMFIVFFYFGIAMLPMMYFASYLFKIPSTGYTRMTLFSVFTGVASFLIVQILAAPGLGLGHIANILHWILLVVPHYSLATGIRDIYTTFATNNMCKFIVDACRQTMDMTEDACWNLTCDKNLTHDFCCAREPNYFKWKSPGIASNIVYSCSSGMILFTALMLMEYKIFSKIFPEHKKSKIPQETLGEDSDVHDEKLLIQGTPKTQLQNDYFLVLKDLTKYYGDFLAVNGLCLGTKKFECFGLLGVNGAGKTTTFRMLIGDTKISYGEARLKNFNIKNVQKLIGYCPQFDGLLDDLTAKETFIMFALLRGVPFSDSKYLAENLAKDFDFYEHLNKQVKELSGGNKRKLSTAISLIGDPPVIFLDEPTTGMDPVTKRYIWDAICRIRDKGKCIVLSSHSMEECEALCTRIAIMVNGNFKCLGSIQHLKNKFAEGYTLTIKVKKSVDIKSTKEFIFRQFPTAIEREKHQELLTFYVVDGSIPWSRMFGILEKAKTQQNIVDYSLGQSRLEQVFLTFTKSQR